MNEKITRLAVLLEEILNENAKRMQDQIVAINRVISTITTTITDKNREIDKKLSELSEEDESVRLMVATISKAGEALANANAKDKEP